MARKSVAVAAVLLVASRGHRLRGRSPDKDSAIDHESADGRVRTTYSLYPVRVDGQWGFIDAKGTMVIEPSYAWAGGFCDGLGLVQFPSDLDGFVDATGEVAIPARFEAARPFHDGLAPACQHGAWGFIDTKGDYVIRPQYESAGPFNDGLAVVETKEGWGYINTAGDFVIEPR